jgi:lipoate synthase
VGQYIVTQDGDVVDVNLYPCADVELPDRDLRLSIRSDYPRMRTVSISIFMDKESKFAVRLRVPKWAEKLRVAIATKPVEVLIPDFAGSHESLEVVLAAHPTVLNHNIETVPRLYPTVRPQAVYERSLDLLRHADAWRKENGSDMRTKSGMMVGLGETKDEVIAAMRDLREVGCDILTIGQYYRSSPQGIPVVRRVSREEFHEYRILGEEMGFLRIASAPLVRSSYHAEELDRGPQTADR